MFGLQEKYLRDVTLYVIRFGHKTLPCTRTAIPVGGQERSAPTSDWGQGDTAPLLRHGRLLPLINPFAVPLDPEFVGVTKVLGFRQTAFDYDH